MFKEETLFFPNRLWRRPRWAVGGATASLLSSLLLSPPGGLSLGLTPGHLALVPCHHLHPHFLPHPCEFLTPKADALSPGHPYRLVGPGDEQPVRWGQPGPSGDRLCVLSWPQQSRAAAYSVWRDETRGEQPTGCTVNKGELRSRGRWEGCPWGR